MKIAFATCSDKLDGTTDDHLLANELISRGHQVSFADWRDDAIYWRSYEMVLVRSTWDYHRHLDLFLQWAKRVSRQTNLVNGYEILEWNVSKRYLIELAQVGVAVVPSVLCETRSDSLKALEAQLVKSRKAVIKPLTSATAELTYLVDTIEGAEKIVDAVHARDVALVQPFIESIATDGEVSIIFFNRESEWHYSHAILKIPAKGDFRVQSNFGGTVTAMQPARTLIDLARTALSHVPCGNQSAKFARVDLVDWRSQPLIGEVEMVEPELFFRFSPQSVSLLASALAPEAKTIK